MDNYIVLDTETTGLSSDCDEILQLSIIDNNGNTLYNQYFKPQNCTEWEQAQAVNGISPEMVKDCPFIKDKLNEINSIISSVHKIIGYNTQYDLGFLQVAGVNIAEDTEIADVMRDFAEIYGEWNDYYGEYKWQKLTTCADYYGYDWGDDTAHDSLGDCRATLFCYKAMKQ
ncbi:MAG: exonuclease domain-containing protein [Acutalibacteraceae bacterium]